MIRPLLKQIDQDVIDMTKFFNVIKNTKIDNQTIHDKMFTEWGKGYINSLCSNNSNLAVVPEKEYLKLKKELQEIKQSTFYKYFYKYITSKK